MSEAAQAIGNLVLPLEPLTVTVKETERLTGLGTTIYKLIGAKELQTVKIGARTLIVYLSIKNCLAYRVQHDRWREHFPFGAGRRAARLS